MLNLSNPFKQWPTTGVILLVGTEAESLALQYAKTILSKNTARSDSLFDAKTHTDFRFIQPEPKSQWIKIDQIRELIDWAGGKPQIASTQVAVISPADALNIQAANALLKTLEESSPHTLFILVTDRPSFIPATIRSRCYWIRYRSKGEGISEFTPETLALQKQISDDLNALKAQKADPVAISAQWSKNNPKEILQGLLVVLYTELKNTLPRNKQWWGFLDKVLEAKRELETPNQPNIQLLMESLVMGSDLDSIVVV